MMEYTLTRYRRNLPSDLLLPGTTGLIATPRPTFGVPCTKLTGACEVVLSRNDHTIGRLSLDAEDWHLMSDLAHQSRLPGSRMAYVGSPGYPGDIYGLTGEAALHPSADLLRAYWLHTLGEVPGVHMAQRLKDAIVVGQFQPGPAVQLRTDDGVLKPYAGCYLVHEQDGTGVRIMHRWQLAREFASLNNPREISAPIMLEEPYDTMFGFTPTPGE